MNITTINQFENLKKQYPDALFLFKAGDCYECYEQDAKAASEILGITLTKCYSMAYALFPSQALDTYLPKLVRNGYRVGILENKVVPLR